MDFIIAFDSFRRTRFFVNVNDGVSLDKSEGAVKQKLPPAMPSHRDVGRVVTKKSHCEAFGFESSVVEQSVPPTIDSIPYSTRP